MKKVKQWAEDHKKEIIIGTVVVGGMILYFFNKNKGIEGYLNCSFRFVNGEGDNLNTVHSSVNFNKPGYTVGDLGKVGTDLMKNIPFLTEDIPIDHLSTKYCMVVKEGE